MATFKPGDMVRFNRDAVVRMGYLFPYAHRAMDLLVLEDLGATGPKGHFFLVRYDDSPEDKLGTVIHADDLELIPAVDVDLGQLGVRRGV